ncbi:MAG: S10 family peptidase [Bradymonadia bacterium]
MSKTADSSADSTETKKSIPPVFSVTTEHRMQRPGQSALAYTATASTIHLKGPIKRPKGESATDSDAPEAAIFSVSYVVEPEDPAAPRPVTFIFNGGPGSSAVWLHMGALGPKRVDVPDAEVPLPPPYKIVDNPDGLLPVTDLVFIDPMSTGFSRPVGEGDAKAYHAVETDAESVAQFIERWLSTHHRWNSPRYIAGESYGTTRAAALAKNLHDKGLPLNGVILISLAVDFGTFTFEPGRVLSNVLFLPTYAATAWYHGKLDRGPDEEGLEAFLEEVRGFARDTYASALMRGGAMEPMERETLAATLEAYTGVPASTWIRHRLRIDDARFMTLLLESDAEVVGRMDSRYRAPLIDPALSRTEQDPSIEGPMGPFTAAVNHHLRHTLEVLHDHPYNIFSPEANEGWSHGKAWYAGGINLTGALVEVMAAQPHLRLLAANGLYDLATPFFASEYTLDQVAMLPGAAERIERTWYPAGHMMYLHPGSLTRLGEDLRAFIEGGADV